MISTTILRLTPRVQDIFECLETLHFYSRASPRRDRFTGHQIWRKKQRDRNREAGDNPNSKINQLSETGFTFNSDLWKDMVKVIRPVLCIQSTFLRLLKSSTTAQDLPLLRALLKGQIESRVKSMSYLLKKIKNLDLEILKKETLQIFKEDIGISSPLIESQLLIYHSHLQDRLIPRNISSHSQEP